MEENYNILDYIKKVFTAFGIVVLIFMLFSMMLGDGPAEISPLFAYGRRGFSMQILFQLFVLCMVMIFLQILFLSDKWIKDMSLAVRYFLFLFSILITLIIMIIVFKWFPLNNVMAWMGFFVSFALSMSASIIVKLKVQAENTKMQDALKRFNNKK